MRFRIPGLLPDTLSAEQVRAFREARGWTVEQLADAVHASPLEVSAWEAGAVGVPPEQAERIRWFLDLDEWSTAVARACGECAWAREHAPQLYEKMFSDVSGTWFAENVKIRDHVMGCGTCRAMWMHAQRIGEPPPAEDVPDTWRTRYRRWTRRFPRWIGKPLDLLGDLPELAIIAVFVATVPDEHSGLPARVHGLVMGAIVGWLTLRWIVDGNPRWPRTAGVLAGIAASVTGIVMWALFDAAADLGDPRLWAGASAVGVALGLIRALSAKEDADPRPAVASTVERAALGAPQPHLDPHVHVRPAAEAVEAGRPPAGEHTRAIRAEDVHLP